MIETPRGATPDDTGILPTRADPVAGSCPGKSRRLVRSKRKKAMFGILVAVLLVAALELFCEIGIAVLNRFAWEKVRTTREIFAEQSEQIALLLDQSIPNR